MIEREKELFIPNEVEENVIAEMTKLGSFQEEYTTPPYDDSFLENEEEEVNRNNSENNNVSNNVDDNVSNNAHDNVENDVINTDDDVSNVDDEVDDEVDNDVDNNTNGGEVDIDSDDPSTWPPHIQDLKQTMETNTKKAATVVARAGANNLKKLFRQQKQTNQVRSSLFQQQKNIDQQQKELEVEIEKINKEKAEDTNNKRLATRSKNATAKKTQESTPEVKQKRSYKRKCNNLPPDSTPLSSSPSVIPPPPGITASGPTSKRTKTQDQ